MQQDWTIASVTLRIAVSGMWKDGSVRSSRPSQIGVREVADLARVSPTTVSNVLSGNRPVSAATKERVRWAIDELDYRPNHSARNLRLQRSGIIALALPEVRVPYFAELVHDLARAAGDRGYRVLVEQTEGRTESEHAVMHGLDRGMVDGIIFSPLGITRETFEQRRGSTPIVLLGERILGADVDYVGTDNVAAAADATAHLASRGRRRIAAIGDQGGTGGTGPQRTRGYRRALRQAGIRYDARLVVRTAAYHHSDGAQAMAELLDRDVEFDAVYCYTDLLAIGAMHTLRSRGLRIPDDVAVIGADDIDEGRYAAPPLTTLTPDKAAITSTALDLLIRRIADRQAPVRQVLVPHTIEVREST